MRHKALLILLITTLHQPLLQAAPGLPDDSHKDTAGLGIGAIIGGLIGGPIGAIAGASGGAWLGDREIGNEQTLQTLQDRLETSNRHVSSLQAQIEHNRAHFERTLVEAKQAQREAMLAQLRGIRIDLYYTTGNSTLRSEQQAQLEALGALLRAFPELCVHLQGYADPRGSVKTNLRLSEQRLSVVRAQLESAGIDAQRIHLQAFGESRNQSTLTDLELLFFERRVSIYLSPQSEV